MNFLDIKTLDIANGPGCRISLFVSGCRRHCPGCFNPESWDFAAGEPFTIGVENQILQLLEPDYITGLSILGGEPFEQENQIVLIPFLRSVRNHYPKKSTWVYTGYKMEELWGMGTQTREMIKLIDVLVDGAFEEDKKDIHLQYCGSTNQRIINIASSLLTSEIIVEDQYQVYHAPMKSVGKLFIPATNEMFRHQYLGIPYSEE